MIVKLQNGNTYFIDRMEDFRDLIDPALYEAIQDIVEDEISERMDELDKEYYDDIEEINKHSKELDNRENEIVNREDELQRAIKESSEQIKDMIKINKMKDTLKQLREINKEYKKNKSKRVDKELLTRRLDVLLKDLD